MSLFFNSSGGSQFDDDDDPFEEDVFADDYPEYLFEDDVFDDPEEAEKPKNQLKETNFFLPWMVLLIVLLSSCGASLVLLLFSVDFKSYPSNHNWVYNPDCNLSPSTIKDLNTLSQDIYNDDVAAMVVACVTEINDNNPWFVLSVDEIQEYRSLSKLVIILVELDEPVSDRFSIYLSPDMASFQPYVTFIVGQMQDTDPSHSGSQQVLTFATLVAETLRDWSDQ